VDPGHKQRCAELAERKRFFSEARPETS
jgi:hypothetical protein